MERSCRGERRYHHDFPSAFLGNSRALAIYLPPGYDEEPHRRYPVLYLHDGQNLFDAATAAFGIAWEVDRTADRLIREGRIQPVILVGIYNTSERIDEYTPHPDPRRQQGGLGRLYARFVAEEVKPFIDRHYRTLPGREQTGVAGSSLGGLISLTIARHHAGHFGLCGVLSPSLWWAGERLLRELQGDGKWMKGVRFWLDVGTREGDSRNAARLGVQRTRRLARRFEANGLLPGEDYAYLEVRGGEHNEAAWAARFDRVLQFFFGHPGGAI